MRQVFSKKWRANVRRQQVEPLERRVLLSVGDLDPGFGGGDGIVVTHFGGTEKALDVALLPGGGIVVAGTRGVMRYGPDGTLDPAFGGGDGRANLTVDATALALQPGGGILAIRSGEVVRFTSDGTRDMTFGGGDGIASAPAGVGPLLDVGVQPDGRIVAAPAGFIGLVGFDATGRLDTSFGRGGSNGGGVVRAELSAPEFSGEPAGGPLAVQSDGSVVVAGSVDLTYHSWEGSWQSLAVARFTPDGLLDPTFSPGGATDGAGLARVHGDDDYHVARDLALAPDGGVIVLGRTGDQWNAPEGFDNVYRVLPDGTADPAFGAGGKSGVGDLLSGEGYTAHPASVAVQADGKVLIAGVANVGTRFEPTYAFALFRLNRDGTPDTAFGLDHDGGVATAIGRSAIAYGVAVQPDGKVLVVGTADGDVAMARYQGDGPIDGDDQVAEAYIVPRPLHPIETRAIDSATDVDLYRFDVAAGRRIGFDVDKSAGSSLNAHLRVFNAAGTQLGSNDDAAAPGESAAGGDPYVEVAFPAAGTYYVGVSSAGNTAYNALAGAGDASGASTGGYSLTLTDRTPRAAGDADFAFAFDGLAPPRSGLQGERHEGAVAVMPDGGFVAASSLYNERDGRYFESDYDAAIGRYTSAGLLETSFGPYEQGVSAPFSLDIRMWNEAADLVAPLPDGRILAACRKYYVVGDEASTTRFQLARYDASGNVDASGGWRGELIDLGDNGDFDRATALAVLPDGRFVVAGSAVMDLPDGFPTADLQDYFVARLNADGSLDRTFAPGGADGDGVVTIDFSGGADVLGGLSVLPDGRMLLAGTAATASGTDFGVAKIKADGTLDTSFGGGDGKVTTDFGAPGGDDAAYAIVPLAGGKFVLAGSATLTDGSEIALACYNPDGTPDATFGAGGKVTTRLAAAAAAAGAAVADGEKILVGGREGFGLARYTAAGALDTTFGTNGFAATPVGAVSQILALPDGGWLVNGANGRARHLAAAFPAPPPPNPGGPQVYQAESATLVGAIVASNHSGYTGTGFVDYRAPSGDSVEFAIDAPAAGTYTLDFRYANGGTYDRPLELRVNGQVVGGRMPFAPTGSWGAWGTSSVSVMLPAGRSGVRLTSVGASGPNLDATTLRPPDTQTLQAEAAALSGAVAASSRSGYTGSGYADYAHARGDFIEWKANLPSAGRYELTFRYANGGTYDRPLDLALNGQPLSPRLSFVPTGGWSVWKAASMTLTLPGGVNTVRLTASGMGGPNIDVMTVRAAGAG